MRRILAYAGSWGLSFIATFGAFWTLADPLGGMDYLVRTLPARQAVYASIGLFSALCATAVVASRAFLDAAPRPTQVIGQSRLSLKYPEIAMLCKQQFAVIGLSLPSFAAEGMLRTYDNLLTRGVEIDILLVNPFSPSLLQRSKRLYVGHEAPNVTAARSLRLLVRHRESLPPESAARFKIRVTNSLPAVAVVIADDTCYWHPYLSRSTGVSSPYIQEARTSGFAPSIVNYVQEMMNPANSHDASRDATLLKQYLALEGEVLFNYSDEEVAAAVKELSL